MKSFEIPYIDKDHRDWRYRALEILPGAISWTVLALPFVLSIFSARATAYFVIGYLLLWFVRTVGLNFRSVQGANRIKQYSTIDWGPLNNDLEHLTVSAEDAPSWHAANIERVRDYIPADRRIKPSDVIHVMMVANYNESVDILEPTLKSIIDSNYDMKKVIVILAYEDRGGQQVADNAKMLIQKYSSYFMYSVAIGHPSDIPGEVIGKGGNITYAARELQKYFEKEGIDPNIAQVTTLDADNRPHPNYMAALTYTFCSTEDPLHVSYQPIPMYLNNIWDAPAPMRVIATGNSFWNIVLSLRPHMLRNFSSHAQSMAALIDTDFWSVRTIVEDGHQFWRTYFRYDGRHEVYPIYLPIYQDAVLAEGYKRTFKQQFLQIRRWAYGASDVAYVFYTGFLKKNDVPKFDLLMKFNRLLESHISWATMPIILAGGALVPAFFQPDNYIANQLPRVISLFQTIALLGVFVSLFLLLRFLPPKPARYTHKRTFYMIIQWALLPFTTILYNSVAALNAQTRLMFGWYLGKFDVTDKAIKK